VKIAVKDASVLIDLLETGLLGSWFKLGIETHVSDLVLAEISQPDQRPVVEGFVSAGLLNVAIIENGDVQRLAALANLSRELKVSIPDASAVHLAETLDQAFLLTSDGTLRLGAERRGLEVRGLLWVLDLLVWHDVLSCADARTALAAVLAANSRQPLHECERRQESWATGKKIKPREPLPSPSIRNP
jgi:hypothetical protein